MLSLLQEVRLLRGKNILVLAGLQSSTMALTWGKDLAEVSLSATYTILVSSKIQRHVKIVQISEIFRVFLEKKDL
jgi:hypothetical protein